MKDYRYGAHNIFDIRLHLVWVTKYRYPILTSKIGYRARDLIKQICQTHEVNILGGNIGSDHVHLYVSIPPQLSISRLIMRLKGRTSRIIQQEFPELRKQYWGQHFWARGYFCVSSGNVTDEVIKQYIAQHATKHTSEVGVVEDIL